MATRRGWTRATLVCRWLRSPQWRGRVAGRLWANESIPPRSILRSRSSARARGWWRSMRSPGSRLPLSDRREPPGLTSSAWHSPSWRAPCAPATFKPLHACRNQSLALWGGRIFSGVSTSASSPPAKLFSSRWNDGRQMWVANGGNTRAPPVAGPAGDPQDVGELRGQHPSPWRGRVECAIGSERFAAAPARVSGHR
jgi:hypothetical protein